MNVLFFVVRYFKDVYCENFGGSFFKVLCDSVSFLIFVFRILIILLGKIGMFFLIKFSVIFELVVLVVFDIGVFVFLFLIVFFLVFWMRVMIWFGESNGLVLVLFVLGDVFFDVFCFVDKGGNCCCCWCSWCVFESGILFLEIDWVVIGGVLWWVFIFY